MSATASLIIKWQVVRRMTTMLNLPFYNQQDHSAHFPYPRTDRQAELAWV